MLSVDEAQERLIGAMSRLPGESVPLDAAAGRILARDIHSSVDLPCFDNSAMDGFAVHADDTLHASPGKPARLRVGGAVPAGAAATLHVAPQEAARIFTGSPMPSGADAVVMQEDTRSGEGWVEITEAAKPFENIRLRGEDVKKGELLASAGDRLGATLLGVLAAAGAGRVEVARQPVVGLISTGDELAEPGTALPQGHIYESNRLTLATLAREAGALPKVFPIVRDTLDETAAAIESAFDQCDAVITSGGVSVGEHDHVKAALERLGGTLQFWRVAMRPGKPFVFGTWRGKVLFGLPGNPVSAFVTFLVLVRPALLRMQGATDVWMRSFPGVLAEAIRNEGDRRHFMRVTIDGTGQVRSAGPQASHRLGALAKANGLLDLAPGIVLKEGGKVNVLVW